MRIFLLFQLLLIFFAFSFSEVRAQDHSPPQNQYFGPFAAGPEFPITNEITPSPYRSDITLLPLIDGGFAAIWREESQIGNFEYRINYYNSSGNSNQDDIVIHSGSSGMEFHNFNGVTGLSNDNTVLIGVRNDINGMTIIEYLGFIVDRQNRTVRPFSLNSHFQPSPEPNGGAYPVGLSASSDGGFVILWQESYQDNGAFQQRLYIERRNNEGQSIDAPILITNAQSINASIIRGSGGDPLLIWEQRDGYTNSVIDYFIQQIRSNGTPLGQRNHLEPSAASGGIYHAFPFGDGGFGVPYIDSSTRSVGIRLVDGLGRLLVDSRGINSDVSSRPQLPIATALDGVTVLAGWQLDTASPFDRSQVRARMIVSDGRPYDGEFRIPDEHPDSSRPNGDHHLRLATLQNGNVVAAWIDRFSIVQGRILERVSRGEINRNSSSNLLVVDQADGTNEEIEWRIQGEPNWRHTSEAAFFDVPAAESRMDSEGAEPINLIDYSIEFRTANSTPAISNQTIRRFDNASRAHALRLQIEREVETFWADTRPVVYAVDGIDFESTTLCPSQLSAWDILDLGLQIVLDRAFGACIQTEPYLLDALRPVWGTDHINYYTTTWEGSLWNTSNQNSAIENIYNNLRALIRRKNETGRPLVIVAHSWGSVLTYAAMQRLADEGFENSVDAYITIGSPLGFREPISRRRIRQLLPDYQETDRIASVSTWNNYYTHGIIDDIVSSYIDNSQVENFDLSTIAERECGFLVHALLVWCAHSSYYATERFSDRIMTDLRETLRQQGGEFRYPPPSLIEFDQRGQSGRPTFHWESIISGDQTYRNANGQQFRHGGYEAPRYWLTVAETREALDSGKLADGSCPGAEQPDGCVISISIDASQYTVGHPPLDAYGSERAQLEIGKTYFWRVLAFERSSPGAVNVDGELSEIGEFRIEENASLLNGTASLPTSDRIITIVRRGQGRATISAETNIGVSNSTNLGRCYFGHTDPDDPIISADDQRAPICGIRVPHGSRIHLTGHTYSGQIGETSDFIGFGGDCLPELGQNSPIPTCALTVDQNLVVTAETRLRNLSNIALTYPLFEPGWSSNLQRTHFGIAPTLHWSPPDGADIYLVCVSRNEAAVTQWLPQIDREWDSCRTNEGVDAEIIGATYMPFLQAGDTDALTTPPWGIGLPASSDLADEGLYFWRVAAINFGEGATSYSAVGRFRIAAPPQRELTVRVEGGGSGEILSQPTGVDCELLSTQQCQTIILGNRSLALEAISGANSIFESWTGCYEVDGRFCIIQMFNDYTVTANFRSLSNASTLTVDHQGAGTGSIQINPPNRTCVADCSEEYTSAIQVSLTATPSSGSTRGVWGGACSGTVPDASCSVMMSSNQTASYRFDLIPSYSLAIVQAGNGTGTVTSQPSAIDCGATCNADFAEATVVTLTASPDDNSVFSNWSGSCSGTTATCDVTMTETKNVTATFALASRSLTVSSAGVGSGNITSNPAGISCGTNGTDCSADFDHGISVTLTAVPDSGSSFASWNAGDCPAPSSSTCVLEMTAARTATARFTLNALPEGRVVAATLPGARSGYVGGPEITVFMSVLSRRTTPLQGCHIFAADDAPFSFGYRQIDDAPFRLGTVGEVTIDIIGPPNPVFDLGNGGGAYFILAMAPTNTTGPDGYVFHPQIECENAALSPIEGVNSVQMSIGNLPVPDIISIGATPSADGIVHIPATGNRISFMSAAATNIGSGDGSAGAGDVTVTVSADTGAVILPLTVQLCETGSDGVCLAPRASSVTSLLQANSNRFFAVFVRANGESTVPFSPALNRVFLRFSDADGTIRSAFSAAVSAPAPSTDQPELQSAIPVGRWSVLVRQGDGEWPSLVRASLYVLPNGTAILDDGEIVSTLNFEGFVAEGDIGRFANNDTTGAWTSDGAIQAGPVLSDQPGDLWGVRDARSDMAPDWAELSGQYGDGVQIASDGSISGTIAGCIVSGGPIAPNAPALGLRMASVRLMGCAASGSFQAIIDVPANDTEPALLLSGSGHGWRVGRVQ